MGFFSGDKVRIELVNCSAKALSNEMFGMWQCCLYNSLWLTGSRMFSLVNTALLSHTIWHCGLQCLSNVRLKCLSFSAAFQINPVQPTVGAQELRGGPHDAFRPQPGLGRALRHRGRAEAILQTSGQQLNPFIAVQLIRTSLRLRDH